MRITVATGAEDARDHPLRVVPVFEGDAQDASFAAADASLEGHASALLARGDLRAKPGESQLVFPAAGGAERLLFVGLGRPADLTPERLRRAAGTAAKQAGRARASRLAFDLPRSAVAVQDAARAVAEGVSLGAYAYRETKSPPRDEPPPVELEETLILLPEGTDAAAAAEGARVGEILGRAENLARELGNLPGNRATPSFLAATAQRIAAEHGMTATVLGREEMRAEGLGALLAVARGTEEEPKLIVLEHRHGPTGEKPLVLVGKGLTFDAGGISIKPAQGMEDMKFDMCGGAATLAAMQAIGELRLPVDVVALVPATENLLGGGAMKPGDVLVAHSGKTIEIVNTDAEGRLILADALSWARRFDPAAIVDAATLTGACVIALGHAATAVMGSDPGLVEELRAAGESSGERCWPLPMLDDYREQLQSEYADIKNSGGRPAGAITAGWFLREFAGEVPWAHLDVAGTAYGDGKVSYLTKGATGAPTRVFVQWVLDRVARREAGAS
jgi:leucyl aminopeptidase